MLVEVALHIVVGPTVVTFGVGLTVTTTFIGAPGHELAVGVTMYVTDPGDVPGFISTWAIVGPLEALAPVIPPATPPIVQLNVAPATLLASAIFVEVELQIVIGPAAVISGVGLTEIVNVSPGPSHVTVFMK